MLIVRAMLDVFLVFFWSVVIWSGGPRHNSYGYALFARWQAAGRLRMFLCGEESEDREGGVGGRR